MSRWPVFVWLPMLLSLVGCASSSSVVPGLANAPPLGGPSAVVTQGSPADPGSDVVSNGEESCESVSGRSPLRAHLPPCPTVSQPASLVPDLSVGVAEPSVVVPWLQHFYVGFPCHRAVAAPAGELGSVALASAVSDSSAEAACTTGEGVR